MTDDDQIAVTDELLFVMREAATGALWAGEKFISPRRVLIALLQDPAFREPFKGIIDVDALSVVIPNDDEVSTIEDPPRERTLAFKETSGSNSVWLDSTAYAVFVEGARRAKKRYVPKDLLLGFVSEWRRAPHVLHDIKIDGTKFAQAAFALPEGV
ncbi:MAG: hypothetical protein M3126_03235 [Candidatus Eremiobacteraeota bacterium]|nr:hypothetical protein [Candidatus Eremiobacteraeota bacterium]